MGASRVLIHVVNESGFRAPLHPSGEATLPVVDRPLFSFVLTSHAQPWETVEGTFAIRSTTCHRNRT